MTEEREQYSEREVRARLDEIIEAWHAQQMGPEPGVPTTSTPLHPPRGEFESTKDLAEFATARARRQHAQDRLSHQRDELDRRYEEAAAKVAELLPPETSIVRDHEGSHYWIGREESGPVVVRQLSEPEHRLRQRQ